MKSQKAKVCNLVNGKFWVNNHAHIIQGKDWNNTKYLYYYLNLIDFRPFVTWSAQPKLTQDSLNSISLDVHNIKDQEKIATVLSILDSKIELNNKINSELEAMAKTLYEYWFVQFDFPDENGKPYKSNGGLMVWNEDLKQEIPATWEVKPISKITKESKEQISPMISPEKEYKLYSIPAFDELGTYKIEKWVEIKSNKFIIKELDVLVSKLNPWFNRVIYATEDINLISSTEFVVWRAENIPMKNYLYMLARDNAFIKHCIQSASGTSNSHKRINPAIMMRYKVPYNREILEQFWEKIWATIKMFAKNQIEKNELVSLRDWLLPMLMNGQVTIE